MKFKSRKLRKEKILILLVLHEILFAMHIEI